MSSEYIAKTGLRCFMHADDFPMKCEGKLITRRSIYGAVTRACEKAWNEGVQFEDGRRIKVDLKGWPEWIREERL